MSLSVSVVTAHTTTGAYHVKQHPQYTITKATAATLNTNKSDMRFRAQIMTSNSPIGTAFLPR